VKAAHRAVYEAVMKRADGVCEACFKHREDLQIDHFAGRRDGTTVEGCWVLDSECHLAKTDSKPSAKAWCERFMVHCGLYGYKEQAQKARTRIAVLAAKGFS
jgi:hypothetical protein